MSILGDLGAGIGSLLGAGVGVGVVGVGGGVQQATINAASQANIYTAGQLQPVQPQWLAAQATVAHRPMPLIAMNIGHEKLHTQMQELVKQLPMSIAAQIAHCGYYQKDQDEAARFLIIFNNDRTLTFYDVDNFPSAEHVGRIALECS